MLTPGISLSQIACAGYVAGGNCHWFSGKAVGAAAMTAASTAIGNRLNFSNDNDVYGSMLAFPLSKAQWDSGKMDTTISITSRQLPWDVSGTSTNSFPGGDAMYAHFATLLGLNTIHYGEDIRASENMEYISQGSVNNALCFLGPHRLYSPLSIGKKLELIPGMGHFGPDAVPGDARWRRGEVVSLKAAREQISDAMSSFNYGFV